MGRESVRRKGKKEGPTRSENQNINLAADLGGALGAGPPRLCPRPYFSDLTPAAPAPSRHTPRLLNLR